MDLLRRQLNEWVSECPRSEVARRAGAFFFSFMDRVRRQLDERGSGCPRSEVARRAGAYFFSFVGGRRRRFGGRLGEGGRVQCAQRQHAISRLLLCFHGPLSEAPRRTG